MKRKYNFLKPLMVWIPGVASIFAKFRGKRDVAENQVCELDGGHITPLVDSKVTSYDSHINKKFLKVTEIMLPMYREAYSLFMELRVLSEYKAPEVTKKDQESMRQAAAVQAKIEGNSKRISEIMVRMAEIKAESDIIDELIRHYEERAEGFLKSHVSRYWRGVLAASSGKMEHFPVIQHKDIDGRKAYAENRNRLLGIIGKVVKEEDYGLAE